ncbi:MAG TPA: aminomethyl transferase family protein [Desulfobacteraceae bacterium]|nr:aminomethyl transferase family protein [Desulfobacteraceae bacterium]
MDEKSKKTPLNSWHRENGANMADFGGFDMPLWYETGVKQEHLAVIESAGIFDTSHMACVTAEGEEALDLLQYCHTRDLAPLKDGRCVYGAILDDNGHVVDDAIVYRFNRTTFMVCVNAGMGKAVADHLEHRKGGGAVAIEDLSERLAKIDVQGKNAARILAGIIENPHGVFETMPYFSFKGHYDGKAPGASAVMLTDKTPLLLSRSGYTGEFGFELFVQASHAVKLWNMILEAGRAFNVIPCGLGARDSLRAGAVLPLSHQDIGAWPFVNHPWPFALALNSNRDGFTKDFVGKEALEKAMSDPGTGFTHAFAGDNLRKIGTGSETEVLDVQGNTIGTVLTCATDMAIGWHNKRILSIASPDLPEGFKPKGISCGFVLVNRKLAPGERLTLQEKKRKITVTIVDDVRPHRTARKKIDNFR